MIYKYLYGGIAVLLALVGLYLYGYNKGQDNVQRKFDDYRFEAKLAYDKQVAETTRVQGEREKLIQEIENDLKPKLDAATANGRSLANRLRDYRTRSCPLSDPARTSTEPSGAAGVPGDSQSVDEALGRHLEACGRDAERLEQFQRFYQSLRNTK